MKRVKEFKEEEEEEEEKSRTREDGDIITTGDNFRIINEPNVTLA